MSKVMEDIIEIEDVMGVEGEIQADAIATVLISKGARVRIPYSSFYGIYVTISLDRVEWEGDEEDGGEGGEAYAKRIRSCAEELKAMREHVPDGVLGEELKVAEALVRVAFLRLYLPRGTDD